MEDHSNDHEVFQDYSDILKGFHPRCRPVLWRILTTQHFIYLKILEGRSGNDGSRTRPVLRRVLPQSSVGNLDWRTPADKTSDDEALVTPRRIAEEYLRARLPDVFGEPSRAT